MLLPHIIEVHHMFQHFDNIVRSLIPFTDGGCKLLQLCIVEKWLNELEIDLNWKINTKFKLFSNKNEYFHKFVQILHQIANKIPFIVYWNRKFIFYWLLCIKNHFHWSTIEKQSSNRFNEVLASFESSLSWKRQQDSHLHTFSIFTSWGRLLTRKRKTVYTICMEMENFPFQICDVSTCGEVGAQNFHFKWLSVIIFSLQGVSRGKKPSRADGWTFSFVSADADVSLNASHPYGANPAFIYIQIRSRATKIEKKIGADRGAASMADWNINCPKVNFMHHNDRRTSTQCSAGPHPKPPGIFSVLTCLCVEGTTTRAREKEKRTFFSNYRDEICNPTWQMAPGLLFHVDARKSPEFARVAFSLLSGCCGVYWTFNNQYLRKIDFSVPD